MKNAALTALLKYNQKVPRYTSYPTANHFSNTVTHKHYAKWLSDIEDGEGLSLYFHIPFCKKMCWYCGCHTKATRQYDSVSHYLAYLKKEVELVSARLGSKNTVQHIHFGGGSPSYIAADHFANFLEHVRSCFRVSSEAEIAVELDPRETTELKVAAYAQSGVNRVSLGVQDFHKEVQTAINRVQPIHQIFDVIQLLDQYGIQEVNLDLLYGLPNQTIASIEENISIATGLNPSRISLFGYAHVPWLKKHMRLMDETLLPDSMERLEQFAIASHALSTKGYVGVGLDHFVRPDDPMAVALKERTLSRNFQGYTTDSSRNLIGFGTSAISDLAPGYAQNTLENRAYFAALDEGLLPTARGTEVTRDDKIVRRLISELMCYMDLDLKAFAAKEAIDMLAFEPAIEKLDKLIADQLVSYENGRIQINPDTPQAVRIVCSAFDPQLSISKQRHAQVA